jgi:hypothetical protein
MARILKIDGDSLKRQIFQHFKLFICRIACQCWASIYLWFFFVNFLFHQFPRHIFLEDCALPLSVHLCFNSEWMPICELLKLLRFWKKQKAFNFLVEYRSVFRPVTIDRFLVHSVLNRNVCLLRLFPSITIQTVGALLHPPIEGIVMQTYGSGKFDRLIAFFTMLILSPFLSF